MRTVAAIVLGGVGVLLGAVVVLIVAVALTQGIGQPVRWELPEGFRGWIEVRYRDPACPPLETDWLFIVITIPPSGRRCTWSPVPTGWRYHRFEYRSADGRATVLRSSGWDKDRQAWLVSLDSQANRELVFVGTKNELDRSGSTEPRR